MSPLVVGALLAAVFVVAAVGTALVRRYALARRILDVPNERSSHVAPTPRGGGVAVVVAAATGLTALAWTGQLAPRPTLALVGGGLLVALVGFIDDHGHVPARWRLCAHFAAAVCAVALIVGAPGGASGGASLAAGWVGRAALVVGLVWVLNLYNFMDGIDGIAGVETVTVCAGGSVISALTSRPGEGVLAPAVLAAAALGFLVWNWPPAKIFMGDAGSGFLGFALGVLGLTAAQRQPALLWVWLILLGAFVVDASVTLFRRALRGERIYDAHRTHAYQHAARRAGRHRPVTLGVLAVNALWLCPWALAVALGVVDARVALLVAYAPLVWLTVVLGAGTEGRHERC